MVRIHIIKNIKQRVIKVAVACTKPALLVPSLKLGNTLFKKYNFILGERNETIKIVGIKIVNISVFFESRFFIILFY